MLQSLLPLEQGQKVEPSNVGCYSITTMKTKMYLVFIK
jgi:hypothetical protein